MRLYIGNLNYQVTDDDLRNLFGQFGAVDSATVIVDKFSNKSKGFGFVEMTNGEEANKAIAETNRKEFMGRSIIVDVAKPLRERDDRKSDDRGFRGRGRERRGQD